MLTTMETYRPHKQNIRVQLDAESDVPVENHQFPHLVCVCWEKGTYQQLCLISVVCVCVRF